MTANKILEIFENYDRILFYYRNKIRFINNHIYDCQENGWAYMEEDWRESLKFYEKTLTDYQNAQQNSKFFN